MTTQTQTPEERLSKLEGVYEQVNERLRDLTQAVGQVDANLREEIRQVDANLRQVEANLREEIRAGDAALRTDMNERFNELARGQDALREETNARFSEMNARFNIMLVLIGGVWATMVGGFIAIFTRL